MLHLEVNTHVLNLSLEPCDFLFCYESRRFGNLVYLDTWLVVSENLGSENIVGAGTYRGMSKGELSVRVASSAFSNQRRNVGCYAAY